MDTNHLPEKRDEICRWVNRCLTKFPKERILMVSYAPAFREWMKPLKTNLAQKYQLILLSALFEQPVIQTNSSSNPIWKNLISKFLFFLVGLIPILGPLISGTQTMIEIARESYDFYLRNTDLQLLQDRLGLRAHRRRHPKKLKQIVFVPDYGALSDNEQNYLGFLAYLVQDGYLSSTALVIGHDIRDLCPIDAHHKKEVLLLKEMIYPYFGEKTQADHIIEILNIIGIGYFTQLKQIFLEKEQNDDLMQALIDALLKETMSEGVVNQSEFHHFLRLCSLLFEPFFQEDIEKNYPAKTLPADELIEYMLKSHIFLKQGHAPVYCFIEYFIRDFYRNNSVYTFPAEVYKTLFCYLKGKYPYQYADIALLSIHVGKTKKQTENYSIIAWYHEHDTMPQRKKEKLREVLCTSECGRLYIHLFDTYQRFDESFASTSIPECLQALEQVECHMLAPEAQCCYLNLIATIAFESGADEQLFLRILDCYFSAFYDLHIFSDYSDKYVEYIADALLLSVGIDLPFKYKDTLERLTTKIDFNGKMPPIKRLRLLRLGNVILSPSSGHLYTKKAYEESNDYPYEHILAAINYSASLLSKAEFSQAQKILDETKSNSKCYRINNSTEFSFENNRIISQVMNSSISKTAARTQFKQIFLKLKDAEFSDSIIVQNNYAAAIVYSAAKSYCKQAEKILLHISNSQDDYHRFFALHNLLILYCLTGDKEQFINRRDYLQVPYLLRWYADFFHAKFDLLQENFDNCQSIRQIEEVLRPLTNQFSELNTTFYQLPVLWGVIERWFE